VVAGQDLRAQHSGRTVAGDRHRARRDHLRRRR
jgi:hypothetical protein